MLLFGAVPILCMAQDTTSVEEQLEAAFEELDTEDAEDAGEQLTQFLEDLAANPVNINQAGLDDFLQVPGINLKIARGILDYRQSKPFETLDELLEVPGIGQATYRRMQPYVSVGGTGSRFRDMYMRPEYWLAGRKVDVFSRYQQNLETREGFKRSDSLGGYAGNAMKYYQRFRMTSNHLSLNLTQEKDAGEPLSARTGFDFNSAHIALSDVGNLNTMVLGDYSLSFGQGLVLWTGGAFGKGREVTGTISKNERGIKPYSSAQETNYFRGAAVSYGQEIELTTFYSYRPRTASIINGDTTRFPSSSGLHRTANERARKNNIDQTTWGGRVRWDSPLGLIGATGYVNNFSHYIAKGSSKSNLFDYEGKEHSVVGIDYRGLLGNAFIFSEWARSQNGGYGGIAGVETPVRDNTDLAFAYRKYSKDFQSFLGTGFGESSSSPQNEEGFYIGLRHSVSRKITLSTYFDQYYFAAPRFGTTQATGGMDLLGLAEIFFNDRINGYLLMRSEVRDDEFVMIESSGQEKLKLGSEKRNSIRGHLEYQLSSRVRLRTRMEVVQNREAGEDWETGFLMYQDVRLIPSTKLRIDGRVTLFDTESFNTRVYQFESDLLYVLSNTVLYNQGQRAYLTVKYEPVDYMDIWFKYGITIFENTQVLGSGLSEVRGDVRNSLGLQVRLQF
ncbi:Helix-hairpin-helix motif-containing protein [Gracilimonas mengyeensis]|uniref:Helix-hairpin-helix motif-containing protein n=2 Tax=Gracilimonas mengyeensis TaxID=1302730 RepID=A0A521C198_9BACT|nr:Helix-hairpin-helix motif-containing protein [Gracilimonas mengyeensis]